MIRMVENNAKGSTDTWNAVSKFFGSIRLTVVLLLTLAITSVFGTVLPQNKSPEAYRQAFGDAGYSLLSFLGLFDMYHSWWFLLLLLILAVNIVVCSIHRLSSLWKMIFTREPKFSLESFRNIKNRIDFKVPLDWEAAVPAVDGYLSRHYGYRVRRDSENGCVFFAEKWRWSRLGVYIVHFSVILLLIGAVIGSIFGFDAYVNIPEGESSGTVRLINSGKPLDLGFSIRCNDFNVSFYDSGMPKEFRSNLSILEGNKEILTRDIIVNAPLRFRGISIYQSSYGEIPTSGRRVQSAPETFTLNFTSKETSKSYTLKGEVGQSLQIPEGLGAFILREFRSSYDFRGNDLGPTLTGTLVQKDGTRTEIVLPVNFPTFDRMTMRLDRTRTDAVFISLAGMEGPAAGGKPERYFTGLQVTKDPGVGVVYAGFILLLAGCAVAFFMAHQQICIEVSPLKNKTRISVSGKTDKSAPGMRRRVEDIGKALQSLAGMLSDKDERQ
jgi:cytochrome c biogenesis protein